MRIFVETKEGTIAIWADDAALAINLPRSTALITSTECRDLAAALICLADHVDRNTVQR